MFLIHGITNNKQNMGKEFYDLCLEGFNNPSIAQGLIHTLLQCLLGVLGGLSVLPGIEPGLPAMQIIFPVLFL